MRQIESEFTRCERVDGRQRRQCIKPATRQVQSYPDPRPWAACNGHSRKAQRNGARVIASYVKPVHF
jgi:hypothetical protein